MNTHSKKIIWQNEVNFNLLKHAINEHLWIKKNTYVYWVLTRLFSLLGIESSPVTPVETDCISLWWSVMQ